MVAPGPSLPDALEHLANVRAPIVAVQDAVKVVRKADVVYGCDNRWWAHNAEDLPKRPERWSTHDQETNDKLAAAEKYDINCIRGGSGNQFNLDGTKIHYGSNSGFQAINLAILFGAFEIALVGFDMRKVNGRSHYFGEHPNGWGGGDYAQFIRDFNVAAGKMPDSIRITNHTTGSALQCFPMQSLDDLSRFYNARSGDRARNNA